MHGIHKGEIFLIHQETDRITAFAAAETVIHLPCAVHVERGSLFLMERTQSLEIGAAGTLELNERADDFDNIAPCLDLFNYFRRNNGSHGSASPPESIAAET